jgi:hypothetical protein
MEGGLAALEGRRVDARSKYLEALSTYRDLDAPWLLAQIGLDAVIADALEPAERQRVADEARAIFERLGARPYLDQLDAALNRASERHVATEARATPSPATDEVPAG